MDGEFHAHAAPFNVQLDARTEEKEGVRGNHRFTRLRSRRSRRHFVACIVL